MLLENVVEEVQDVVLRHRTLAQPLHHPVGAAQVFLVCVLVPVMHTVPDEVVPATAVGVVPFAQTIVQQDGQVVCGREGVHLLPGTLHQLAALLELGLQPVELIFLAEQPLQRSRYGTLGHCIVLLSSIIAQHQAHVKGRFSVDRVHGDVGDHHRGVERNPIAVGAGRGGINLLADVADSGGQAQVMPLEFVAPSLADGLQHIGANLQAAIAFDHQHGLVGHAVDESDAAIDLKVVSCLDEILASHCGRVITCRHSQQAHESKCNASFHNTVSLQEPQGFLLFISES